MVRHRPLDETAQAVRVRTDEQYREKRGAWTLAQFVILPPPGGTTMTRQSFTRRQVLSLLSAPAGILGAGVFTEAEAATGWNVFGNVHVGGIYFSVGVHAPHVRPYGGYPGYYYRTSHRIRHRRHRCSAYCYQRRSHYYHHESCPLLGWHLQRYGAPPAYYGPRYGRREYRGRYERDDYGRGYGGGDDYYYDDYDYRPRHRGRGRGRRRRRRRRDRW